LGGRVALSADGKALATTSGNYEVQFFDTVTGEIVRRVTQTHFRITRTIGHHVAFALAADGRSLLMEQARPAGPAARLERAAHPEAGGRPGQRGLRGPAARLGGAGQGGPPRGTEAAPCPPDDEAGGGAPAVARLA